MVRMATGPAPFKTTLDTPPADTLKARQTADKARQAIVNAVKSVKSAQDAVNEASALGKDAAPLLAAEGLTPDVLKTFLKTAGPLVDAFTVPAAPETPVQVPTA